MDSNFTYEPPSPKQDERNHKTVNRNKKSGRLPANVGSNATPNQNSPDIICSEWQKICSHLMDILDPQEYQSWISPLKIRSSCANELVIAIPNLVFYKGILDRFSDTFEATKLAVGLEKILLRFEIDDGKQLGENSNSLDGINEENIDENLSSSDVQESLRDHQAVSRSLSDRSFLNPNYTFDTFVRGQSNQFANATCNSVADAPGQAYNPLFIYGSTGLGKTHLLHAVGHTVMQSKPNYTITYVSSERFMNEMIYCLRFNKMWDFRRKYRNCDLLLIDDVQFISGKDRTQQEFFHTFNTLYEAKKQIVITSDMFPQDIPDIEDRLRNRFQWGLIADIQPPSIEHRVAILINKAAALGIKLSEDVAHYIAHHARKNVRELEGALHRITAFSTLHAVPIDMDLAINTFKDVLGEAPKRVTTELIQRVVAEHYRLRVIDLKSQKRQRALTVPRQIAMYLTRTRTNASFPEIGSKFGGKDHTTVMHAVKKVDEDRNSDLDLKTTLEALERKIDQSC